MAYLWTPHVIIWIGLSRAISAQKTSVQTNINYALMFSLSLSLSLLLYLAEKTSVKTSFQSFVSSLYSAESSYRGLGFGNLTKGYLWKPHVILYSMSILSYYWLLHKTSVETVPRLFSTEFEFILGVNLTPWKWLDKAPFSTSTRGVGWGGAGVWIEVGGCFKNC